MQLIHKFVIFLSIILALFCVIYLVVRTQFWAPNSSPVVSSGGTSIEYWGTNIPEEVMNVLIQDYQKKNSGVKINYTKKNFQDSSEYRKYAAEVLRTDKAPDIIQLHSSWVPYLSSRLSTRGDLFTEEEFKAEFYSTFKPACYTKDNTIRCIPIIYDGLALVYNKGMFSGAGLQAPVTWEDVRDSAIRLTKKNSNGAVIIGGAVLGSTNNISNSTDIVALMMSQSEVKLPDNIDSEAASRAFDYYTNFVKIDKVWDANMPEAVTAFATEKAAMAIVNTKQLNEILAINPTINIGVTKVPQLPVAGGSTTSRYLSSVWVEAVSANSSKDKQRESWGFIKWLSEGEQQLRLFQLMDEMASVNIVYANKKVQDQVANSPLLGAFARSADSALSSSLAYDSGNTALIEEFRLAINNYASGRGGQYIDLKTTKENLKKIMSEGF